MIEMHIQLTQTHRKCPREEKGKILNKKIMIIRMFDSVESCNEKNPKNSGLRKK